MSQRVERYKTRTRVAWCATAQGTILLNEIRLARDAYRSEQIYLIAAADYKRLKSIKAAQLAAERALADNIADLTRGFAGNPPKTCKPLLCRRCGNPRKYHDAMAHSFEARPGKRGQK